MERFFKQLSWGIYAVVIFMLLLGPTYLFAQYKIKDIGGFEDPLPSYWTKGSEPGGATLSWATDEYLSLGRSLKISKEVTGEAASWVSENMCDQWTPIHAKDKDWLLGAYVKTLNVNTNPANADAEWYLLWEFYNQGGTKIGETRLPIDQSVATSGGWVADTNAVSETILPEDSYTTIVRFVGGPDATGTVWVDNLIMAEPHGAKWSAMWNDTFICPTGWFYWLPSTDGEISHGYENTLLTDQEAHTGLYSLMFDLPFDRQPQDAFIGAKRVKLDQSDYDPGKTASKDDSWATLNAQPGDMLRISVWVKAENLVPDSAAAYPESWSCGFTPIFFESAGNNDGFDDIITLATDRFFKFPDVVTEFDWTEYYLDIEVPEGSGAMSVRLHPYSKMTGTVYFDDLSIKVIGTANGLESLSDHQALRFELVDNYPNPFNPTTTISYSIPTTDQVTLQIFNVLGQHVRTLVDEPQSAGHYQVVWDGKDIQGHSIGSGVYFYQLRTTRQVTVKRMVLVK